jgi:hypothetical protein
MEDWMKGSLPTLVAVTGLALLGLASASCSSHGDASTGVGVDALVFVKRQHTTAHADGTVDINVSGDSTQVIDYLRYVPGGGVYLLSPARADGTLKNLTQDFPEADIAGVDVSFDAKEVVYAMKRSSDDHYHIYTTNIATGETHQKTFGDNDDVNPIYAPGDRIVFVTNQPFTEMGTRADEYEHGRVVTQLATITVTGGDADRKLCAQNLSHTVNPFLRSDGSIGYSRWEHLGGVNDVKVFSMAPDCTQMLHVAGQFGKFFNSIVQVNEVSPNVMVGIATTRERTIQAGALLKMDARWHKTDGTIDENRLDSEHVAFDVLTPGVPTGDDPSPVGRYRNPRALPDGRLIVSWADGVVNDTNDLAETPPDFGLYLYDPAANPDQPNQLIYNDKQAWDVYPIPVVVRKEPNVIGSVQNQTDATHPAQLGSLDIKNTDLGDEDVRTVQHYAAVDDTSRKLSAALAGAVRVRVVEGFSSEGVPGVTMFGLTMDEGAAILGEANIQGDGSWLANVPPYVPIHLQPIDKFGMAVRNQRLWIQAMPGESRVCGGCHESRTGDNTLGINQNLSLAGSRGPENLVTPVADRVEYPWLRPAGAPDVAGRPATERYPQELLTAKCAGCHNATQNGSKAQEFYTLTQTSQLTGAMTTYQIPWLDLTDTPITVYYDRQVKPWPASYVSIFYPATLDMMANASLTGNKPPNWGIPESARQSVLIEKLNIKSGTDYAWDPSTHPLHPEDVGVTLTDNERQMLIRVMDLGGQYYARQGSAFTPNPTDPTAASK